MREAFDKSIDDQDARNKAREDHAEKWWKEHSAKKRAEEEEKKRKGIVDPPHEKIYRDPDND